MEIIRSVKSNLADTGQRDGLSMVDGIPANHGFDLVGGCNRENNLILGKIGHLIGFPRHDPVLRVISVQLYVEIHGTRHEFTTVDGNPVSFVDRQIHELHALTIGKNDLDVVDD